MSVQLHALYRDFLDHLKYQKRYSEHTISAYHDDLRDFQIFLAAQFSMEDPREVKPALIRSALAALKEEGKSSRSIMRKISSLRSFYKYLLRTESITVSPMAGIINPKLPRRLPEFVDEPSAAKLFSEITFSPGFPGTTERLILSMLYNTGMRRSELVGLRDYHIDIHNRSLKVLGKGNKERIIPAGPDLLEQLTEYMEEKKRAVPRNEDHFLFVSDKGKQLTVSRVYAIVRQYLSAVTTLNKKSPHILRHSFATQLMNNGADINAVKELLGHSSLAATQIYTHNSIEKLKDVYKKAHPKA